jgi:hypothetical protein
MFLLDRKLIARRLDFIANRIVLLYKIYVYN